ncbi:hypothetical protein FJZ33_08070 [Candidatus Poribacteria bacterium]|nr:hypothetical protein [Candidatus Poribacteria bacterium]
MGHSGVRVELYREDNKKFLGKWILRRQRKKGARLASAGVLPKIYDRLMDMPYSSKGNSNRRISSIDYKLVDHPESCGIGNNTMTFSLPDWSNTIYSIGHEVGYVDPERDSVGFREMQIVLELERLGR